MKFRYPPLMRYVGHSAVLVFQHLWRWDWAGMEHFPQHGGYIIACNHITDVDPITTGQFLLRQGIPPRYLAKDSLFRIPIVGRLLRATEQVPVYRDSVDAKSALVEARKYLDDGQAVTIFPEGTLTKDPNFWPMRGRPGVALLALESRCPVVPIAQWGAQELFNAQTRKVKLFSRPLVTVRVGPPVDLSDLYGREGDRAALLEATSRIMAAITAMLADIRQEEPPERPFTPGRKTS